MGSAKSSNPASSQEENTARIQFAFAETTEIGFISKPITLCVILSISFLDNFPSDFDTIRFIACVKNVPDPAVGSINVFSMSPLYPTKSRACSTIQSGEKYSPIK